MKIYHWGIIGLGKIARKFADDLRLLPNARLWAVASTSQERADAFAEAYNCPHTFGAYEALCECPELDIVYIATPHQLHYENTMMCLRRGIPVLCEKPFALHAWQAREMVALARSKGVFVMEAIWTTFIPAYHAALKMAASGAIGKVQSAKADFGYFSRYNPESRIFNPLAGGGSLYDVGIYPALFFMHLFGTPAPEDIQASAAFSCDGIDETCTFIFRYPQGQLAMGHSSVVAHTPVEATIFGTEGQIRIHGRFHESKGFTVMRYDDANNPTVQEYPFNGWGYQFEAAHVMNCLAAGQQESDWVPLSFTLDLSETLAVIAHKIGLKYND